MGDNTASQGTGGQAPQRGDPGGAAHRDEVGINDTVAVRRSALARLHRHIRDAHERSPTRRLKQAILIAEHMLNGDR